MTAHNDIETSLAAYNAENEKFNKGNAAAGTRARKALAELKHAVMKLPLKRLLVKKQRLNHGKKENSIICRGSL
jgi:hypothetical protein